MMNAVTTTMLTSTMSFAWTTISAGERVVAVSERLGLHEKYDERAGFVEQAVWRTGRAIVVAGEALELRVNALAMWLGYNDAEVSSWVAEQLQASAVLVSA